MYTLPIYAVIVLLSVIVVGGQLIWRTFSCYLRLRKFPGPFLACISNLWLFRRFSRKEAWRSISVELHQQYGPIVRYGPNRLAFGDPAAIHTILGTHNVFEKGDSYDVLNVTVKGQPLPSFISAKPESRHTALKKHIATAFSPGGIIVHEETVDTVIEVLIQQLKQNGPVVELASFLRYFAMDSLTRIAFSEDLGFMLNKQDIDNTLAGANARFDHWHFWIPMPWLEKLLLKNPFVLNIARPTSQLAQLAGRKIGARMLKENVATRPDLLSKYLEAHEKDPEVITPLTVTSLTISTIHAGADTTAAALAHIFNNLLRHPSVLAKLRTELSTANLSTTPRFNDLNKLPLLDAVIKESMRATPIAGDMMERVVPPSGADIAGTWVPGGTVVSVSHHVTDRDPETWGPDGAAWRPERWLEADELQRRKMERAYIGFSAGKRMCLGMHLAILELKKCISRLIGEFEMSLADPEQTYEVSPGTIASPKDFYVRLQPRNC